MQRPLRPLLQRVSQAQPARQGPQVVAAVEEAEEEEEEAALRAQAQARVRVPYAPRPR